MSRIEDRHLTGINFEWVYVRELRFVDNLNEYDRDQFRQLEVDLQLSSEISEDNTQAKVLMGLTLRPPEKDPDLFQTLSAKIEAGFSVLDEGDEPVVGMEEFVRRQAPAILLPFLRQEIAEATAKTRFGQLLLPPINVSKLVEEIERSAEEAAAGEDVATSEREPSSN